MSKKNIFTMAELIKCHERMAEMLNQSLLTAEEAAFNLGFAYLAFEIESNHYHLQQAYKNE